MMQTKFNSRLVSPKGSLSKSDDELENHIDLKKYKYIYINYKYFIYPLPDPPFIHCPPTLQKALPAEGRLKAYIFLYFSILPLWKTILYAITIYIKIHK